MNISTEKYMESNLVLLAIKGKALPELSLVLARKFYIRKNKNKVILLQKGAQFLLICFPEMIMRIVVNHTFLIIVDKILLLLH